MRMSIPSCARVDNTLPRWYPPYALAILLLAYVVAFIDRQVLNLLVEPIRHDTGLSDTQISLLQGLSFAVFVSFGGLPIGRLVDTRRRTGLLAAGIVAWTLCTGAFGIVGSFAGMLAARVGVGVGEATMTPSAYSLIGDYFDDRRLGIAAAVYGMGAFLGSGLALVIGAGVLRLVPAGAVVLPVIGSIHGWQLVFLLLVPIGLVAAAWVWTLREPERRGAGPEAPGRVEIAAYFRRHGRAIFGVDAAIGFVTMATYGLLAWAPALLGRHYGLPPVEAGWRLGLVIIVACSAGTLGAGYAGDVLRRRGLAAGRLMVLATALAVAIPFAALAPRAATSNGFFALVAPLFFLLAAAIGSGPATLQEITPNRMRGIQHAIAVLASSLIGLGVGPTAVALVTDRVLGDPLRVGESLALVLPIMLAAGATSCLLSLRSYARTLLAVTR